MIKKIIHECRYGGIQGLFKRTIRFFPSRLIIKKNKNRPFRYGLNETKREKRVIISMTSFKPRFKNICQCLKSLLYQTVKPDRIVVWFGSDVTEDMLTDEMRDLEQYGIEYHFDNSQNLMPHKKYFYAMQEEPESIVITVDDDAVYSEDLVSSLLKSYKKNPGCISARRVHKITRNPDGSIASYRNWKKEYTLTTKPSFDLMAVGVGGVLYPPNCLCKEAFDAEKIQKYALRADDIWLKYMETLNHVPVVWVRCSMPHPPSLEGIQSLNSANVEGDNNDVVIQLLHGIYGDLGGINE